MTFQTRCITLGVKKKKENPSKLYKADVFYDNALQSSTILLERKDAALAYSAAAVPLQVTDLEAKSGSIGWLETTIHGKKRCW